MADMLDVQGLEYVFSFVWKPPILIAWKPRADLDRDAMDPARDTVVSSLYKSFGGATDKQALYDEEDQLLIISEMLVSLSLSFSLSFSLSRVSLCTCVCCLYFPTCELSLTHILCDMRVSISLSQSLVSLCAFISAATSHIGVSF
jgi:hypothetical protein